MIDKLSENFCFDENDFMSFGVRPFSVLKIFSKLAAKHAEILDIGFKKMLQKKLLWVTMRIKYQIERMPKPNEPLHISTYPSGKNMLEYDRDFLIEDENGNAVIKGTSKWCLISSETRRIAKISEIEAPELPNIEPLFEGRFLKGDTFEPEFLPDYTYEISRDDIDNNNHTNNTIYAKILEPILKREKRTMGFFQINFLRETHAGDLLDIYKKHAENSTLFFGKIREGEPSFSVEMKFKVNNLETK